MIRAVRITAGQEAVRRRREGIKEKDWCNGPARVCAALGIGKELNGYNLLLGEKIWVEDRGVNVPHRDVERAARIGVDYAGAWALKPWRLSWKMG